MLVWEAEGTLDMAKLLPLCFHFEQVCVRSLGSSRVAFLVF